MDLELKGAAQALLKEAKLGPLVDIRPLPGGANNRVFLVEHAAGKALLKAYFRKPGERDRLASEFAFSQFLRRANALAAPEALACDERSGLALFEFIEGRSCGAKDVDEAAVRQAAVFVREINARPDAEAKNFPLAADACLSPFAHADLVNRKLAVLDSVRPVSAVDLEAAAFLSKAFRPAWERALKTFLGKAKDDRNDLPATERRLSPSDFGFHNAMVEPDGRLRFFDFEYAGWDDPAKLVADFFGQVALPVDDRFLPVFLEEAHLLDERLQERLRWAIPTHRYKWVCLVLNEFTPGAQERRRFASDVDIEERKALQLKKAKAALERAKEPLQWHI